MTMDTSSNGQGPVQNGAKPDSRRKRRPFIRYDQIYDQNTSQTRLIKSAKPSNKRDKAILVIRRLIDSKGFHTRTEVDIRCRELVEVLKVINTDMEETALNASPPSMPLFTLYHNRSALQARLECASKDFPPNEDLLEGLNAALQFLEEEYSHTITCVNSLTVDGKITWELLWAIFPPNSLVYYYDQFTEQHQVLKLRKIEKARQPDPFQSWYWEFRCDIVADDGQKFGIAREPTALLIDEFAGARFIQDLIIFPLQYHPLAEEIRNEALRRGRIYVDIVKPRLMKTSGPAMFEKRDITWKSRRYKFNTQGRAIVDPSAFRTFNPNVRFIPKVHHTLQRETLTDELLMICTPVALGFSFGDKKWGGLPMSRLIDITWNDQAFQDLVMNEKQKTMIYSMVKQHHLASQQHDDVITGKGKGVIALFSGAPGCGKTLTAESVAEITKKPLYTVSAGELGISPDDVDQNLARILELAHKWEAVLLIDEADVFIEERTKHDLTRNALVSIFLKQLEYFQGILVLTTNRVDVLDPAFSSRIHIMIDYPPLGETARKQVWETFLHRARGFQKDLLVEVNDDEILNLAKMELNGRQVKNIVACARTIAKEMETCLSMTEIQLVLDVALPQA